MLGRMRTPEVQTDRAISDDALEVGKMVVGVLDVVRSQRRGPATVGDGVSAQGIRAAIHLYQHGEMTIGELADGLGISRGWASRVVEELERAGHIVRRRQRSDRRVVRIRLSPRSIAYVEGAYRGRIEAIEASLAPFDDAERAVIVRFLRRLGDEMRTPSADDVDTAQERPPT